MNLLIAFVRRLKIAADTSDLDTAGTTVGIPVAHEVEGVAAGGGVPGLAQEPVGVATQTYIAKEMRSRFIVTLFQPERLKTIFCHLCQPGFQSKANTFPLGRRKLVKTVED